MGASNPVVGSKRLVLVAPGSRGDVQPFVALAGGLRRAGYLVRVATHEAFRGLVGPSSDPASRELAQPQIAAHAIRH